MYQKNLHVIDRRDPDYDDQFNLEEYIDIKAIHDEEEWRDKKKGENKVGKEKNV